MVSRVAMRFSSRFQAVQHGPSIEAFQLNKQFTQDKFKLKVDLSIGAYRDGNGQPWALPVVSKAKKLIAEDSHFYEYLPILGNEDFSSASVKMLLGEHNPAIVSGRVLGVQTLSATGGLRVGAELLKHLKYTTFYYSNPTWVNHHNIFIRSGFTQPRSYRYWNASTRAIDFDGLIHDLKTAPENSVIILHACAHNPTGIDPTHEQWEKIADVMEERKLFPFFDSAYQGFASGDLDRDAWAVRYFVKRGFELFCSQSYSKNMGLYNMRTGNLTLVMSERRHAAALRSQLTYIACSLYSNPPACGARLVSTVLTNKQLYNEWRKEIQHMTRRIVQMREALRTELMNLRTPGNWDHIVKQIGLFSYTGLTQRQSEYLIEEYHIYLLRTGRVNICGLNPGNVQYVARAIHDAVNKFPAEQL